VLDSRQFVVRSLLADGVVQDADVRRATESANASGGEVLDALVSLGIVTSRRLAIARAKICEYPFVDVAHYDVDFRNARLIPRATAERLNAFPLFVVGNVVTVAMIDAMNLQAIDQLRHALKQEVDPVVADADSLRQLMARAYSLTSDAGEHATDAAEQTLTTGEEPIVAAINQILAAAAEQGASDVHISPDESSLHLRYRVDGSLRVQQGPDKSMHAGLVQRLKVLAKLDLAQARKPQDGKFRFVHRSEGIDVRLSLVPTIHGENAVMRLLRSATALGELGSMGMSEEMGLRFRGAINSPHGMILVTGPTGSGKTTTLYTALSHLNKPDVNIITIEDPVEFRLPMIRQIQAAPDVGLTFATALRTVLRQDPDVVLVGEIRDEETAQIAAQAAMTGHVVFSTLHTNDAVGALARLRDLSVPDYAINASLRCVVAQRLVRKLCTCSVPETDSAQLAAVPIERRGAPFLAPVGCGVCQGQGFKGRLGVFEMLMMTPPVQAAVERRSTLPQIEMLVRDDGMLPLWLDALDKAARGLTSLADVFELRLTTHTEYETRAAA